VRKFVVVAGNIGVGKSTLVNLLSDYLGWRGFLEPVIENPYLPDFYEDMHRWGFHSQVHFLAYRYRLHREVEEFKGSVLLDRSIYEDAEIFAKNLYLSGALTKREFETYYAMFQNYTETISPPDLIIYLRAGVENLQRRINQRDRAYERAIPVDYLSQLSILYEEWVQSVDYCPVLTVPADNLNYVAHPQHLALVAQKILERLSGVEEVVFNASEIPPVNEQ
jgi:deoxyadenosine/deoxycytidine kinase